MSGLISFDSEGAFGPAAALIYNASYYNEKGINEIADLLEKNFQKLANQKPKGKMDFCYYVINRNEKNIPPTPVEIVTTQFFQSMQRQENFPLHSKVLENIVPPIIKMVQRKIPHAKVEKSDVMIINQWIARFLECYMSEEQVKKHSEIQESVDSSVLEERQKIGEELSLAAKAKHLNTNDVDHIIRAAKLAMESLAKADHFSNSAIFTGKYLTLFGMNKEDPKKLSDDVLGLLAIFKQKISTKTE